MDSNLEENKYKASRSGMEIRTQGKRYKTVIRPNTSNYQIKSENKKKI